jgi:hypothetical protein
MKKFFAMDDMHALRPVGFIPMKQIAETWPVFKQSIYLHWKGVLFARRYLRIDELFFVTPIEKAPMLLEVFLKNLAPEN